MNSDSVFIFGLEPAMATKKLQSLLLFFKSTIPAAERGTISFVHTPNTVTLMSGKRRHLQVVTRLYPSKQALLNGFDLDSSCFGYDGTKVRVQQQHSRLSSA
jgi:hypothetical protein